MTIGIMEVNLVDAKGLRNNEFLGGGIDPYVVIQYKSEERQSSIAQGGGSRPVWNEKLRFRVEYPGADDHYKLILKVMDHDTFSADDALGQATYSIYLKELFELGVENGKAEIHPRKYSLVQSDQTYCGEIQVGITFTLKEQNDLNNEEDYGGWKESDY